MPANSHMVDGGRFQIEVGELDDKYRDDYISSDQICAFNIYKFPGMKALNVSENGTALSMTTDLCSSLKMQETQTKTTQAVKGNAVTVQVTPNQATTKVYIGNATEAATEATINPADYPVVYEGQYPYAVVPVKLVAPNGTERTYSILTQIKVTRIKVNKHPADVTCYDGDKVSLEVAAKSLDGGTLSYQWYKVAENGDELINNAVKATFEPATDAVGEASYYCVITDTLNETTYSVKSNIATVSVKDGSDFTPVIVLQPERTNISCNQGDDITLSVEVLNPRKGELSYQWYKNSKAIEDDPSAKTKDYKPNTDVNCTDRYYMYCNEYCRWGNIYSYFGAGGSVGRCTYQVHP